MAPVVVVADAHGSAAEVVAWLGAAVPSRTVGTWQEAAGTVAYAALAGTDLPLVIGPLCRAAVEALAAMRAQQQEPPVAFYTEVRATDNDATLIAQYGLVGILHQPFAAADRAPFARYLGASGPAGRERVERVVPGAESGPDRPEPGLKAIDLGLDDPPTPAATRAAPAPARRPAAGELPTGVQRLLAEAGAAPAPTAATASARAPTEPQRLPEPRPIAIIAVEDAFATGSAILGRVGNPGQRVTVAPSYAEALRFLEQYQAGTVACELLIGPLSAEGVALVRTCRSRGYPTHVLFYTESQRQSQDARLVAQYGCLAILRRAGMYETLEGHIAELRAFPRRAPAVPQERPAGPVTRSGEIPVPMAAPPDTGSNPARSTSGRLTPGAPAAPAPAAAGPSSASGRLTTSSGATLPAGERPAVPLRAGRSLRTPGAGTDVPAAAPRAQQCPHCHQQVSVVGMAGQAARCPLCQQSFTVR